MRAEQFLNSQKTEAILLAYTKKLYTFNACALGFDPDVDENEDHPVISGGLGDEVATTLPAYVLREKATADFLFLGTADETKDFLRSSVLEAKHFKGNTASVEKALTRPSEGDFVIARIPICLLKVRNTAILEGLISDDAVLDSMRSYHNLAASWLAIQLKIIKNPSLVLTESRVKTLDENLIPKSSVPIRRSNKLDITFLMGESYSDNSLSLATKQRILSVLHINTEHYKKSNPDLYATPITKIPSSSALTSDISDDATQSSVQALIDKKYK